ncbi:MAG: DUF1844 domain-containing protein [Vulcanimicrobiota bacterium]
MSEEQKETNNTKSEIEEETNEEPEATQEETTQEEAPFDLSQLLPDSMEEIIKIQVLQLREWAHIHMGLIPHPKHKKTIKDMKQCKLAIDSASVLSEVILPHLNSEEQREMKLMLSDLKMNFISRSAGE